MELAPILPSGKMVGHSPMTYSGERLKQNNVLSVMLCFHSVRESLPIGRDFCIFAFLHFCICIFLVLRVRAIQSTGICIEQEGVRPSDALPAGRQHDVVQAVGFLEQR